MRVERGADQEYIDSLSVSGHLLLVVYAGYYRIFLVQDDDVHTPRTPEQEAKDSAGP